MAGGDRPGISLILIIIQSQLQYHFQKERKNETNEAVSALGEQIRRGLLEAGAKVDNVTTARVDDTGADSVDLVKSVKEGLLRAGASFVKKTDLESTRSKLEEWIITTEDDDMEEDDESIVTLDADDLSSDLSLGLEQFDVIDHDSWLA